MAQIKIITFQLFVINFVFDTTMPKQSNQNSSAKKKSRREGGQDTSTSHNTKKKLIEFITKSAQIERKLEIVKQMLAEEPQFTPSSLFYRFDSARKKFITEKDIEDFLVDSNISYKGSDLKTLFGRIDVNQTQSISLREFQNFILPNQNPRLRYEAVRRPVIIPRPHEKLNEKVEWITAKFFKEIIQQYTKLSSINNSLINSFDFNANKVFDLLSCGETKITPETIQMFLQENGHQLSRQEIGCVIKLIDKKGEARINRRDLNSYLATLGLKKEHEIFDELSPIPALKDFTAEYIQKAMRERDATLKQRYKDNKSYVRGMDEEGHHMMGYSRVRDEQANGSKSRWLNGSHRRW